jgi:hypothetical protein
MWVVRGITVASKVIAEKNSKSKYSERIKNSMHPEYRLANFTQYDIKTSSRDKQK